MRIGATEIAMFTEVDAGERLSSRVVARVALSVLPVPVALRPAQRLIGAAAFRIQADR